MGVEQGCEGDGGGAGFVRDAVTNSLLLSLQLLYNCTRVRTWLHVATRARSAGANLDRLGIAVPIATRVAGEQVDHGAPAPRAVVHLDVRQADLDVAQAACG